MEKYKEDMLELIRFTGEEVIEQLSDELRNDKEFMLKVVEDFCGYYRFASEELQADKDIIKQAAIGIVGYQGLFMVRENKELCADKEVVMAGIGRDENDLHYMSDSLRNDRDVFKAIIKNRRRYGFEYECDFDYVSILNHAGENIQADREIVTMAAELNPEELQFASKELLEDKQFMLNLSKKNCRCFKYASDEIKADREFVTLVADYDERAIYNANEGIRRDKEFMFKYVKKNGYLLKCMGEEIKSDKAFIERCVKEGGKLDVVACANEELRCDKEYILELVEINGLVLKCVSEDLQNDYDVVMTAKNQNVCAIEFASDDLKKQLGYEDLIEYDDPYPNLNCEFDFYHLD